MGRKPAHPRSIVGRNSLKSFLEKLERLQHAFFVPSINNNEFKIELLPDPVLPQIAIFSPFLIFKSNCLSANVLPLSYDNETF